MIISLNGASPKKIKPCNTKAKNKSIFRLHPTLKTANDNDNHNHY